ncbi:TadE family protein [Botrimarina mediterranea]|uniref:TadE/TadG family type IV pilus assembly protein n=1 Tax=Botrimarina mediterranea TaxID=2528022 RepID=UPI0011A91674
MTSSGSQPAFRRQRSGVVATEFALVCPVLLLMALACADFGRVSHFYETVSNAARVGAETGATQRFSDFTRPLWEQRVRDATLAEMETLPNFNSGDMTYALELAEISNDQHLITVDVSYTFRTIVAWPGLPSDVELRKRVSYRQFR